MNILHNQFLGFDDSFLYKYTLVFADHKDLGLLGMVVKSDFEDDPNMEDDTDLLIWNHLKREVDSLLCVEPDDCVTSFSCWMLEDGRRGITSPILEVMNSDSEEICVKLTLIVHPNGEVENFFSDGDGLDDHMDALTEYLTVTRCKKNATTRKSVNFI